MLCKPVTVNGEEDPDAVYPPGEEVAVYEVISTVLPVVGALNVTVAAPLLNALFVPTSTAETPVGASGGIKLSCADDLIPLPLVAIITPYF